MLPLALDQQVHAIPAFALESGVVLRDTQVAYKTWGKLNERRDNVMVICHALTGSADVEDWWGPMMGRGKAFDPTRFFIFSANVLGSPYGSSSPLSPDPETGKPYGPSFPRTTIRDDVWIHKLVLDALGVSSVAVVIGGSMGGMHVLEWPLCTPPGYVRAIVPLATCAAHSAWCIAWGEAQRRCVYTDPDFEDGWYYDEYHATDSDVVNGERKQKCWRGLAAARMVAMLTYRSAVSFGDRFGRKIQPAPASKKAGASVSNARALPTPPPSPPTEAVSPEGGAQSTVLTAVEIKQKTEKQAQVREKAPEKAREEIFSAQSYLRYQGDKFVARFDANCFVHITHKMDTHDVARGRSFPISPSVTSSASTSPQALLLSTHPSTSALPALVISISSDVLFPPSDQALLHAGLPQSRWTTIESGDGHDGFLLEFKAMNERIIAFLEEVFGKNDIGGEGWWTKWEASEAQDGEEAFEVKKTSVFGEAEVEGDFEAFNDTQEIKLQTNAVEKKDSEISEDMFGVSAARVKVHPGV